MGVGLRTEMCVFLTGLVLKGFSKGLNTEAPVGEYFGSFTQGGLRSMPYSKGPDMLALEWWGWA